MSNESQAPQPVGSLGLAFSAGLLFAAGLVLAGMTQPAKVLGFLNITAA
ncbi:MAG: YeeE/YedE family protein, partial [Betaproteobacteria bacterium]|nr:YeeE/YedE family protein [Betaproteobacteria bacterium]